MKVRIGLNQKGGNMSKSLYLGTMTTKKKADRLAKRSKSRGHTNVRVTKTKFHGTNKTRYNVWGK